MWVPVPMGPERASDSHGLGIIGNCELYNMGAENWTQEQPSLLATEPAPAPRNPFQKHICQDSTPNHRFFVMYVWFWKYGVWGMFCKVLKLLSSFLSTGPILCMLGNSSTIEISMFFWDSLTKLLRPALGLSFSHHSLMSSWDYRPVLQGLAEATSFNTA